MPAVLPLIGGILNAVFKVGEYSVPPIKRQFDYVRHYSTNIEDLQEQVEKLEDTKVGIQRQVRAAKDNLEIIAPDVEKWLKETGKIKEEMNKLLEDTTKVPEGCIKGRCLKLKMRYMLSRRAKKMSKDVIQLRHDGKFERVAHPASPSEMIRLPDPPRTDTAMLQSIATPQSKKTLEIEVVPIESDNKFKTRKSTEETLMATLLDPGVNIIGLCGIGGIGKTTMVERIGKILKEKKLFDEVVMAVVTQQPDCSKIQAEIAYMLRLKLEETSTYTRADRLQRRILGVERILVILDDIWGWLDLKQLGIPSRRASGTCKILLTSRARDVCLQMGAEVILPLEVLSSEEAWILFSEEAGISNYSSQLYPTAKKVANECKGLPIALISVARALKHKSESSWKDALVQLKRPIETNISEVLPDVYQPLELSYSHLRNKEAQNLFLLCSLFGEDSNISIEDLVRYGIGLAMFNGIINLQEGRNRTHALIEILKDHFLLVDGHKEGYVKMHDVVRDFAISVASKNNYRVMLYFGDNTERRQWINSYEKCTHISIFLKYPFRPLQLNCPNLVFLLWECENLKLGESQDIFEKLKTLKVIDMRYMDIPVLPSSFRELTNLQALHLCGCKLENISFLGELVNLEILSFRGSYFKILPARLGKMANLRLLDLTDCEDLQIIEQGAIAGLTQLEELYVPKSYAAWAGNKNSNAGLTELELLSNLTTLKILIANRNLLSRNLQMCRKLTGYDISIRAIPEMLIKYHTLTTNIPAIYARCFQKAMDLFLPAKTQLGEWIVALLKSTEDLRLNGDGSNTIVHELDSVSFQYLKQLAIQDCKTLEHLATVIDRDPPSFGVFPMLETLYLHKLPNLHHICHGQLPARSFGELRHLHLQALTGLRHFCSGPTSEISLSNLRSIYIYQCQNLISLFSVSVAESLSQLEDLEIVDCHMMEKVFFVEDRHDRATNNKIEFPNLNKLVLRCLHKATTFCAEVDKISFPQLRVLKMEDLSRFKGFCATESSLISRADHNADLQTLFNNKVVSQRIKMMSLQMLDGVSKLFSHQVPPDFFHELESLEVDSCHGLDFIFSSSEARALVKLKRLIIRNCRRIMKMIEKETEAKMNKDTASLNESKSPGLFHKLEYLEVDGCDRLETLFPPSVAQGLVELRELRIRNCKIFVEVIEKENEQAQVNNDATPFPQLKYLNLLDLPNIKKFWHTNYDLKIPSLKDVIVKNDGPLIEQLANIAIHAKQMIAYRNTCKQCLEELVSASGTQGTSTTSTRTTYASCKSYICPHKEEREDHSNDFVVEEQ